MRITGSPLRAIRRVSAVPRLFSLLVATSLPVISRPQAAALTKIDGLWPRWARQSPRAELVADQPVGGGGVGHAQERLGEAHQGDALLAGERELLHQRVDAGGAGALAADLLDQLARQGLDGRHLLGRHARLRRSGGSTQACSSSRQAAVIASRRGDCGRASGAERHGDQLPKMSTGTREMICRTGVPYLRRACSTMSWRSQADRSSGWVEITIRSGWKLFTASSMACSGR